MLKDFTIKKIEDLKFYDTKEKVLGSIPCLSNIILEDVTVQRRHIASTLRGNYEQICFSDLKDNRYKLKGTAILQDNVDKKIYFSDFEALSIHIKNFDESHITFELFASRLDDTQPYTIVVLNEI